MKEQYKIIRIYLQTYRELIKKFPPYIEESMCLYFQRVERRLQDDKRNDTN